MLAFQWYQLYVLFSLCILGLDEVTNKYLNDVKQSSLHSMVVKQTILSKTLRYPGQIEDVMNWWVQCAIQCGKYTVLQEPAMCGLVTFKLAS